MYLFGRKTPLTVEGGITVGYLFDNKIKLTRSSESACGIKFADLDLSEYNTVTLYYTGLTSGPCFTLYCGTLSDSSTSSSGTLTLDISNIKTGTILMRISGTNGSVTIQSLVLSK